MKISNHQKTRSGFTLIELVTVVTIIALLFSLVVGGFSFADKYSKRQRSEVAVKAIRSALENYSQEFGEYPAPKTPDMTIEIAKKNYIVGEAACLYQAMSGDGYDAIVVNNSSGLGIPNSDGELDPNESKNVMLKDMPKEIWARNGTTFYMVDGFGNPLRYIKAGPIQTSTGVPVPPVTINISTYDIWALNGDEDNRTIDSIDTTRSTALGAVSQGWTKNW